MVDFDEVDLEEVFDSEVEDAINSDVNFKEGIEKLDLHFLTIEEDIETTTFVEDLDLPSDTHDLSVLIVIPPKSIEINIDYLKSDEYISCEITQFQVPPLLCIHPEPTTERDDDFTNLKQILSDALVKLAYLEFIYQIVLFLLLITKLQKNLVKLIKEDKYFQHFLPELLVLHLRK